jgi:hypothetical protein
MSENEMEYRGSKSVVLCRVNNDTPVKEQRVDGGCIGISGINKKNSMLRCTLMGLERDYQLKILSNQINRQKYIRSFHTTRVALDEEQNIKNLQNFTINP